MSRARVLVVLGMHRSGTSCLAGCLRAGLGLDSGALWGPDNPAGHNEDPEVVAINECLLAESEGSWRGAPSRLVWSEALAKRRDELVDGWRDELAWRVVKDPRLAITWAFWAESLRGLPMVAIVRHPTAVLDSLVTRGDDISELQALQLWLASYRTVAARCEEGVPVVMFGPRAAGIDVQLPALVRAWGELGWEHVAGALDVDRACRAIDRSWMHHDETGWDGRGLPEELIAEADEIYRRLEEQSVASARAPEASAATSVAPGAWRTHVRAATDLEKAGRYDEAIRELDLAADLAPNATALRLRTADMALEHGMVEEAMARCDRGIEQEPTRWWLLTRARCLLAMGRPEEAIECLDSILATAPPALPAYRLRIMALARVKRWSRLVEVSEPICGDESPWIAMSWRAAALLRLGERRRADDELEALCAIAPDHAREAAYLLWADALAAVGEPSEAESVYQELLEGPSPPLPAYMGRVRLLRKRGEWSEALRVAEAACAAFPENAWPRWEACALALQLGEADMSAAHLARAAEIAPEHPETIRLRAVHGSTADRPDAPDVP